MTFFFPTGFPKNKEKIYFLKNRMKFTLSCNYHIGPLTSFINLRYIMGSSSYILKHYVIFLSKNSLLLIIPYQLFPTMLKIKIRRQQKNDGIVK